IVTDIAGTTRDVIEENVRLGDLTLSLSDTAGIRSTDDVIESMGVDIAYKKIDEADLILAVFDCTSELDDKEKDLISKIYNKNTVVIINKIDEDSKIDKKYLSDRFKHIIEISAKNEEGTEKLVSVLEKMFISNKSDADEGIIANERQKMCLEKAHNNIIEAKEALNNGAMLDAVTVCLDMAAENLMELTGEKASDTVVNDVFSRFCVGK
ncbi:MAG: GTP-binding protein, partial [Oscillospiraceae bacterium]|nr:GTP-binding protein [Oscillospiraceae bacterium]